MRMTQIKALVKDVQPYKNALVTRSNKLVEARYKLSLVEQKVVYAIISTIQPTDEAFFTCRFKIADLAKTCNFDAKTAYKQLEEVTRTLRSRGLTIRRGNSVLQTGWINSAEYFETEGIVEFCLDNKLEPYLLQLKSEFTKMKMAELMSFKSQYTGRIYELVYQYKTIGQRKMSIKTIREYLSIDITEYNLFGHFKSRVIDPAVKEINANTSIALSYITEKTGRKITDIVFTIKDKDSKNNESLGMDLFATQTDIQKGEDLSAAAWGKFKNSNRKKPIKDCPKCKGKGKIVYAIGDSGETTTVVCDCYKI